MFFSCSCVKNRYTYEFELSVHRIAKRFGLRPMGEDEDWNILWADTFYQMDKIINIKRYQVEILYFHLV